MDDQALVEGSVVFKDEDDPATQTRVRHSTACQKRSRIKTLGLCCSLNTSAHPGQQSAPLSPHPQPTGTWWQQEHPESTGPAFLQGWAAKVLLLPNSRVCTADIRMQSTAHIPGTPPALHHSRAEPSMSLAAVTGTTPGINQDGNKEQTHPKSKTQGINQEGSKK